MKKLALTNYYNFTKKENNDHVCPHCSRKIKKWALAQCSSCNRFFCRSHMEPSIGHNKKCPGCRKHQKDFVQSEPVFTAMKAAESKIKEFRLAESQEIEYALFASIFANKNLVKFAQEQNPEQDDDTKEPQQELNQNQPIQPQPVETQSENPSDNFVESAADALASKIAESLKEAGITSDTNEAAAQMLNLILSESNHDNIKIAQKAQEQTSAQQAFKGNPAVGMTESIAMQPQYHPADQAPYGQLTPQEAKALNSIYDRYLSTYGRALFENLPIETPNPVINERNRKLNETRAVIRSKMLYEITNITNDPSKLMMFYRMNGLDPSRIIGQY